MDSINPRDNIELLPEVDDKVACITLDLENDWYLKDSEYDHLTFDYIDQYVDLITELEVPISVFVVGKTLEKHPSGVNTLRTELDSEFHLHSYSHDLTKSYNFGEEIERGVRVFKSFFDYPPIGYRAPQGNITPKEVCHLDELGFKFDSSVFPSYRPGVYNNLSAPTSPYRPAGTDQLVEYPIGAIPRLRIPLSQSYLKLFGRPYLWSLKRLSLPDVLVFDSHLQDFYRTASHDQLETPIRQIHQRNLNESTELFRTLVQSLRERGYEFATLTDVHERMGLT
jgi:peptidoglycan/xylan/chitin deacetylase (PgdA/CDA1 family)